jgi:hypothetical protein
MGVVYRTPRASPGWLARPAARPGARTYSRITVKAVYFHN